LTITIHKILFCTVSLGIYLRSVIILIKHENQNSKKSAERFNIQLDKVIHKEKGNGNNIENVYYPEKMR
jgi:hypothetical protein